MRYKRLILAVATALGLVACSPETYQINLKMRHPSDSGIDPVGKSIAIVYLEDGSYRDSLYNNCVADGLAQGLEKEYFGSERAVEVFNIVTDDADSYAGRDSLVSLVMDTGADIVMLLGRPQYTPLSREQMSCTSPLYIYDSMDRRDTVRMVSLTGKVAADVSEDSLFPSDAMYIGLGLSRDFKVKWVDESFTFIYFDMYESDWEQALYKVENLDWSGAATHWLNIVTRTSNACRRSCAEYNLAIACFMQGDSTLALQWLDLSDSTYPISLSSSLRRRITATM